jgi:hypothetical protein
MWQQALYLGIATYFFCMFFWDVLIYTLYT